MNIKIDPINDIALLEHELFEANFEWQHKSDYDTAHAAAINNGKFWNAPQYE